MRASQLRESLNVPAFIERGARWVVCALGSDVARQLQATEGLLVEVVSPALSDTLAPLCLVLFLVLRVLWVYVCRSLQGCVLLTNHRGYPLYFANGTDFALPVNALMALSAACSTRGCWPRWIRACTTSRGRRPGRSRPPCLKCAASPLLLLPHRLLTRSPSTKYHPEIPSCLSTKYQRRLKYRLVHHTQYTWRICSPAASNLRHDAWYC